ncbi:hypothetical protein AB0J86_04260 [Micromonospora sp. NPDC049559]|uniref:hypothetical protein n=1 Tax=Micromonospora sp. NPDC049559 TaxID=3155923 RepID=UPI003422837C
MTELHRAARFAPAFGGGSWRGGPISESRVSRWESGFTPVPYAAVRRYEELLLLPRNAIVAPLDVLYRYISPPEPLRLSLARGPALAAGPDRLDQLLDLAVTGARMRGADWDELTSRLLAEPGVRLVPSSSWSTLTDRLVAEMVMSDGVAWQQRYEALNRLLVHPRACAPAIDSCASLARDRDNQIFIEPMSALEGTGHPDAARHVLAQLRDPTHQRARIGALLASLRKVPMGHFSDEQHAALVQMAIEMLSDRETSSLAAQLAVELRIERETWLRLNAPVRRGASDSRGDNAVQRRTVSNRIAHAAAVETAGEHIPKADDIFSVLVEDALFHPSPDVRLYTGFLLDATPYRAGLANALAAELTGDRIRSNPGLAEAILDSIRVLGGAGQEQLVQRLIVASGVPSTVRIAAAFALGHFGAEVPKSLVLQVARQMDGPPTDASPQTGVMEGTVYAAGLKGDDELLRHLISDRRVPTALRRSANWWLNRPGHVRQSASR